MKRVLTLLLAAALCLACAACRRAGADTPPAAPAAPVEPAPAEPLRLAALNVELAVDGRDASVMLKLRDELPQALTDALAAQGVETGSVAVTFGTSGAATQTALQSGAVQLAFLRAEDYYPYRGGLLVAAEAGGEPALSQSVVVSAVTNDAAADDRLADALRAALPDLTGLLAPYTGAPANGAYVSDVQRFEQLSALYEAETKP